MISEKNQCKHNIIERDGFRVCTLCGLCFGPVIPLNECPFRTDRNGVRQSREFHNNINNITFQKSLVFNLTSNLKRKERWKDLRQRSIQYNSPKRIRKYIKLIRWIGTELSLPDYIVNNAIYRYIKGTKTNDIGNNIYLSACCILYASRHYNLPLRYSDLIQSFNDRTHRLNKRLLIQAQLKYNNKILKKEAALNYQDYLSVHLNLLNFSTERFEKYMLSRSHYNNTNEFLLDLRSITNEIIETFKKYFSLWGNNPAILSASIIYFASKVLQYKNEGTIKSPYILSANLLGDITANQAYSIRGVYNTRFKKILKKNIQENTDVQMEDD